jgi:hypothetical protein
MLMWEVRKAECWVIRADYVLMPPNSDRDLRGPVIYFGIFGLWLKLKTLYIPSLPRDLYIFIIIWKAILKATRKTIN